jgi:hypothetical protein
MFGHATRERTMSNLDSGESLVSSGLAQRRSAYDGSRPLRNPHHEHFAGEIARMPEHDALGKPGEDAYVSAGFARHRRNHVRLMRQDRVAIRIDWLRRAREASARAAGIPPSRIIEELHARGIERFDDLVDRNAAGMVIVQDFGNVPVEIGIGALKLLHSAFSIKMNVI